MSAANLKVQAAPTGVQLWCAECQVQVGKDLPVQPSLQRLTDAAAAHNLEHHNLARPVDSIDLLVYGNEQPVAVLEAPCPASL